MYIYSMRRCIIIILLIPLYYLFATIPPGYYTTLNGKKAAALKTELHNILMQDTSRYYSYGSGENHTWNGFYNTDRDIVTNQVIDMYSNIVRYFVTDYITLGYPGFGQELHIEHSLPKSWWGSHEWAAYKDLNHLYPADGSTNLSKNDNPLGVVRGTPTKNNGVSKIGPAVYDGYTGAVFEPADQYKGDFARSYFYMATAYEHYKNCWDTTKPENMLENNTYPVFKIWAINLLLQWSRQDPVSQKEIARNENVYTIQGNRNPFIDIPELAEFIWGTNKNIIYQFITTTKEVEECRSTFIYNDKYDSFTVVSPKNTHISYEIFTVSGQKIEEGKSQNNTQIKLHNITTGIYIIRIEHENHTTVKYEFSNTNN